MKTVDFLRSVLESDGSRPPVPRPTTAEALVEYVRSVELSEHEAEQIAEILVEKFWEGTKKCQELVLPRVGQKIGIIGEGKEEKDVVVTKVEQRQSKDTSTFWVVGVDFGGRGVVSKMVYPHQDDTYKVSWQVARNQFRFEMTDAKTLKAELARNVFNL